MKQILFVCTGNSCRSVMAAGLFNKMAAEAELDASAESAGVSALDGFPATEETVNVMKAEGVDVSRHRSRRLSREMLEGADKIYALESIHRHKVLEMAPETAGKVALLAEEDIADPIHTSDAFYKKILGVIRVAVKKIVEDLKNEANRSGS